MNVLLVDLDDTLIPDLSARDQALATMLAGFGRATDPSEAWPIVRQEWRDSGLRSISALTGVSSWEALWTDFDAAVTSSRVQVAGHTYQANVWRHLLPDFDPVLVGAAFRHAREELVRTFDWVPGRVTVWAKAHDLWCVTNGSLWLQHRKLKLAGLQAVFSAVVTSGEVGAEKSDPRFHVEIAARLENVGSVPIAVVGDSDASDGALARALGVRYARVRPGRHPGTGTGTGSGCGDGGGAVGVGQ